MRQEKTTHLLAPLISKISNFFIQDVSDRKKIVRAFFYLARLAGHVAREFGRDLCPQKAAALAYTSVLSLVPVLALFVLYFKVAGKLDVYGNVIQNWVFKTFVADSAQNVTVYLDQFIGNIHATALGTLGAIGLVVTAYLLFRTIERSLNDIWKVRTHRSFIARFQILASLLVLVPAFMTASLYISGKFQKLKVVGRVEFLTTWLHTLFFVAPYLLNLSSFFLVFKFLPHTKVRWKPALLAALFAAALFEFAKAGFNFYVVHVVNVSKIYGTLGLLPILLLWIYFSWVIILLGVELSYAIQNYEALEEEQERKREVCPLDIPLHEEWGLKIALALARRFEKGQNPITVEDLAEDVGLKIPHVEDHLLTLQKAGYVTLVSTDDDAGYLFTRPLENIGSSDLQSVFRKALGLSEKKDERGKPLSELI
jgi:membrane protein